MDSIRSQELVFVRESLFGTVVLKAWIHLQSAGLAQNTIRKPNRDRPFEFELVVYPMVQMQAGERHLSKMLASSKSSAYIHCLVLYDAVLQCFEIVKYHPFLIIVLREAEPQVIGVLRRDAEHVSRPTRRRAESN